MTREKIADYLSMFISMAEGNLYKEDAIKYIETKDFKSELQRKFNLARINNFSTNNNVISTIDGNNRIYHYMTNLPKGLKKYFNIKYQI